MDTLYNFENSYIKYKVGLRHSTVVSGIFLGGGSCLQVKSMITISGLGHRQKTFFKITFKSKVDL